jgi:hypothetical protein
MFQTKIVIPHNTPIYALSDIHADIDALIIALRDCAHVIKKKEEFYVRNKNYGLTPTPYFSETNIRLQAGDAFLEYLLLLDLNDPANECEYNKYCDLGYEWCGGNSHIVIIGDILDGLRPNRGFISANSPRWSHQYPQIEVKILKFLNKLDEYASILSGPNGPNGGRVIKLLGNHECVNFTNPLLIERYCFANTIDQPVGMTNYYKNYSRLQYFSFNGPGFSLFQERGCAVLVVINDTIFVHGDFNETVNYADIIYINTMLNTSRDEVFPPEFTKKLHKLLSPDGMLMGRKSGDIYNINNRIDNKEKMDDHCRQIDTYIDNFCRNYDISGKLLCNKNSVRIVLGHCIQSETHNESKNITISNIVHSDNRTVSYSAKSIDHIYIGQQDHDKKILFGISMECAHNDKINYKIYKVDVGLSRAFDIRRFMDKINFPHIAGKGIDRKKLLSMAIEKNVPQVLKIQGDSVTIVKSLSKNTRLYQPRIWIEKLIQNYDELKEYRPIYGLNNDTKQIGGNFKFYNKYVKYKTKYYQLKNR